jgi:hypothetical protein
MGASMAMDRTLKSGRSKSGVATVVFGLGALLAAAGCATGTSTQQVKMGEIDRAIGGLTGLPGDPLEKEKVEYLVVGKPKYDQFFKSSAEMRAGFVVSEVLSQTLTTNLKSYARSYAASKAADESVKQIVGTTPLDQLSEDQSIALLRLKKEKESLSAEEKLFLASSVGNTAHTVSYLARTSTEAQSLVSAADSLSRSLKDDFTGLDAGKVPLVSKGITTSVDNVQNASSKSVELAKNLTRLGEGLKSLSE